MVIKYPSFPVMLTDDEPRILLSISATLASAGITNIIKCTEAAKVFEILEKNKPQVLMLDLRMPGVTNFELLDEIIAKYPEIKIIMVTGTDDVNIAVECMKKGIADYLLKPIDRNRLISSVRNIIEICELKNENREITNHLLCGEENLEDVSAFKDIVTQNAEMKNLFRYCEAISKTRQAVLITGETGTGKELFARALHKLSERKGKFVPVNLAGLDSNVFYDTLFGHVKGAFTGADAARKGLVEEASGGTLFLDEIGDLQEEAQIKLLRLLQEYEYVPLGSDTIRKSDTRIIVATHRKISEINSNCKFRKDLFYRLQTHHIKIPPLKKRHDDIPLLLNHFIQDAAAEIGIKKPSYPKELVTLLENYDFPGNVRELRAMVYDAVSGQKSMMLSMEPFQKKIHFSNKIELEDSQDSMENDSVILPHKLPTIKKLSDILVKEAMHRTNNNQHLASKMLGITQQALSKRLKTLI